MFEPNFHIKKNYLKESFASYLPPFLICRLLSYSKLLVPAQQAPCKEEKWTVYGDIMATGDSRDTGNPMGLKSIQVAEARLFAAAPTRRIPGMGIVHF
jgi:hypothetical protein